MHCFYTPPTGAGFSLRPCRTLKRALERVDDVWKTAQKRLTGQLVKRKLGSFA